MTKTKMQLTGEAGTDFWNDSCSVQQLSEAVAQGAVGATSNPVIVHTVVSQEEQRWVPELRRLIDCNGRDTEEDVAARLVEHIGRAAARVLEPVYQREQGRKGRLSMQVNPRLYRDPARMLAHAERLARGLLPLYYARVAEFVDEVRDMLAADQRIGPAWLDVSHGKYCGFGGFCFPKDLRAFSTLLSYVYSNMALDGWLTEEDASFMDKGIEVLKAVDAYNDALLKAQGLTREQVMRHAAEIPLHGVKPVRVRK